MVTITVTAPTGTLEAPMVFHTDPGHRQPQTRTPDDPPHITKQRSNLPSPPSGGGGRQVTLSGRHRPAPVSSHARRPVT